MVSVDLRQRGQKYVVVISDMEKYALVMTGAQKLPMNTKDIQGTICQHLTFNPDNVPDYLLTAHYLFDINSTLFIIYTSLGNPRHIICYY